jgi:CubicO group peptidase (beta-lactamase class C family)
VPAGADFWLGLPESEEHRVAPVIPAVPDPDNPSAFTRAIRADRQGIPALALLNQGGFNPNSRAAHAAEIGGAGGLSSGRGLAHLYRRFADASDTGARTGAVHADTLGRMATVTSANEADATLGIATRFSLGFMCSMDNRRRPAGYDRESVILGPAAFGHVGAGGSIGFADPTEGLSFGYAMNRMGEGILLNERGQALVDATYRSLGYRSDASGAWRR